MNKKIERLVISDLRCFSHVTNLEVTKWRIDLEWLVNENHEVILRKVCFVQPLKETDSFNVEKYDNVV